MRVVEKQGHTVMEVLVKGVHEGRVSWFGLQRCF